ncbi:hypothetical protein FEM55_14610 [Dyadobacter sediminis]|uniref:Uncharacterized protein n=1 Tax=Dyadobacter sediminis TaxID=1493691 RepID=A0A5R9KCA2_9BACT|nr:hypothetical protein FEM55_14610 [Dyadobacter sediminis]
MPGRSAIYGLVLAAFLGRLFLS